MANFNKIREALGLFPSLIKSGESWGITCQDVLDDAREEIVRLETELEFLRGLNAKVQVEVFEDNGKMCIPGPDECLYVSREQAKEFFGLVDAEELEEAKVLLKRHGPALQAVDKLLHDLSPLVHTKLNIEQAAKEIR